MNAQIRAALVGISAVFIAMESARAQPCEGRWLPWATLGGLNGPATAATMWDPDGEGPMPEVLVVGGNFSAAGDTALKHVGMWDGEEWRPLGTGISGAPSAMRVYNGELVVAGSFTHAGDQLVNMIARWNGTEWSPLADPSDPTKPGVAGEYASVTALGEFNGALVVGGAFTVAGPFVANRIAFWSDAGWQPLLDEGDQVFNGVSAAPAAIAVYNGDLVVAGAANYGSIGAARVARWDGANWQHLTGADGAVPDSGSILALAEHQGELYVGGTFSAIAGVSAPKLATWNGNRWANTNAGFAATGGSVNVLASRNSGLYVAGKDLTNSSSGTYVGVRDGSRWRAFFNPEGGQGLNTPPVAIVPTSDGVIAAGDFTMAGNRNAYYLATWDASGWRSVPATAQVRAPARVKTMVEYKGDLYLGGFADVLVGRTGLTRWNGATFVDMPVAWRTSSIDALCEYQGDLVVSVATTLARWNGREFSPFPLPPGEASFGHNVLGMIEYRGDLVVGGGFSGMSPGVSGLQLNRLARWNGSVWSPMSGAFVPNGFVPDSSGMVVFQDHLLVGMGAAVNGVFTALIQIDDLGSEIFPDAMTQFRVTGYQPSMLVYQGDLIATGEIFAGPGGGASGAARWNGSSWSAIPVGIAYRLAEYNGDLITVGRSVKRVRGDTVTTLATYNTHESARAVATYRGELIVGGKLGGAFNGRHFARWTDTNAPWIAIQPEPVRLDANGTLELSVVPATGYSGCSVQWFRDGVAISDGLGGAGVGGGTVAGATTLLSSPYDGTPAVLAISNAQRSDSGAYTAVVSNSCGSEMSVEVEAWVCSACPGDFDGDGTISGGDIATFFADFEQGLPCADTDLDGGISPSDIATFFFAFEAGGC